MAEEKDLTIEEIEKQRKEYQDNLIKQVHEAIGKDDAELTPDSMVTVVGFWDSVFRYLDYKEKFPVKDAFKAALDRYNEALEINQYVYWNETGIFDGFAWLGTIMQERGEGPERDKISISLSTKLKGLVDVGDLEVEWKD